MLRVVSLLPSATEMLACIVAKQPKGRLGTIVSFRYTTKKLLLIIWIGLTFNE